MSLLKRIRHTLTLSRWENPSRILIDRFVADIAGTLRPGTLVLDAGAGECVYAPLFAHCQYVSCDRAVGDALWDYGGISVIGDLSRLPFRAASFDVVLSTQTLEHISDPEYVIGEFASVLRPGGRLCISVPFLGDPIHQAPYDFYRYTHYSLQRLIDNAGLIRVAISPLGGVWLLFCSYLWWFAIVYKSTPPKNTRTFCARIARALRRVAGAALVFLARFCTMVVMSLPRSDFASDRFTYGYTVIAEKPPA